MNECEMYRPLLAAMAEGDADALPPDLRAQAEAHRQGCAACREELAADAAVTSLLTAAAPPAVSHEQWQTVWEQVERKTTARVLRHPALDQLHGWARWANAAASIAVAALFVIALTLWPMSPAGGPDRASSAGIYAFATEQDSDIEAIEAYGEDQTPIVITAGLKDVLVVWVVQEQGQG